MYLNAVFKYNVFKYCPALILLYVGPLMRIISKYWDDSLNRFFQYHSEIPTWRLKQYYFGNQVNITKLLTR